MCPKRINSIKQLSTYFWNIVEKAYDLNIGFYEETTDRFDFHCASGKTITGLCAIEITGPSDPGILLWININTACCIIYPSTGKIRYTTNIEAIRYRS